MFLINKATITRALTLYKAERLTEKKKKKKKTGPSKGENPKQTKLDRANKPTVKPSTNQPNSRVGRVHTLTKGGWGRGVDFPFRL